MRQHREIAHLHFTNCIILYTKMYCMFTTCMYVHMLMYMYAYICVCMHVYVIYGSEGLRTMWDFKQTQKNKTQT